MCHKKRASAGYSDMCVCMWYYWCPCQGRENERIVKNKAKHWELKLIIMNVWHFMSLCVISLVLNASRKEPFDHLIFHFIAFFITARKWVSGEFLPSKQSLFHFSSRREEKWMRWNFCEKKRETKKNYLIAFNWARFRESLSLFFNLPL